MKWEKPEIKHGEPTKWGWMVLYPENLVLGNRVDLGAFTLIHAGEGVIIGDNVQIGGGCFIYSVNSEDQISGNVVIHRDVKIGAGVKIFGPCEIEAGAKIDAGAVIGPRGRIGQNATIGVNAYLKTNTYVEPGSLWMGNPAKKYYKPTFRLRNF